MTAKEMFKLLESRLSFIGLIVADVSEGYDKVYCTVGNQSITFGSVLVKHDKAVVKCNWSDEKRNINNTGCAYQWCERVTLEVVKQGLKHMY